ncbi:MAG: hypothetical protein ACI8Z1_001358 [Candidatus Azotimanducaceae bacterium]|jgi:hypothetical protein
MSTHGQINATAASNRFTKLFPNLRPAEFKKSVLETLSKGMTTEAGNERTKSDIPAGYTYFGQFVDHDATRDASGGSIATPIPATQIPVQLSTPSLDLNSLYGDDSDYLNQLGKFTLKQTNPTTEPRRADLERNVNGRARIADSRNEDNLVVMHFHILFQQLHNKIFDLEPIDETQKKAEEVKKKVIYLYQHIILHDFLPRIIDEDVYKSVILSDNSMIFRREPSESPTMPVEFSGAAYRFGHSMVRERYHWNKHFDNVKNIHLLKKTGICGHLGGKTQHDNPWYIDWDQFVPGTAATDFNKANLINTKLASSLGKLPHSGGGNLAYRNMARGVSYGLPSGQEMQKEIARTVRLNSPLTTTTILSSLTHGQKGFFESNGLHNVTPAWYYFLLEAQIARSGKCLGPVASQIVAEVLVNLIRCSKHSILRENFDPTQSNLSHLLDGKKLTLRHIIDYASDHYTGPLC